MTDFCRAFHVHKPGCGHAAVSGLHAGAIFQELGRLRTFTLRQRTVSLAQRIAVLSILAIVVLPFAANADDRVILHLLPEVRVISSAEGTTRELLSATEQEKEKIRVAIIDGKLLWQTRGSKEMEYSTGGIYEFYRGPAGAGYIAIENGAILGQPIRFFEHVRTGLTTITYWGTVKHTYDPPKRTATGTNPAAYGYE